MPITMQEVLARLDTDEPDYTALATMGPEAVPHLKVLVRSDDPGVAAKAAYLASLIESAESADVLESASTSPHETVRVAAASGMRNLAPAQASQWVERLLEDSDVGVRKQALHAVAALRMSGLEAKVRKMATADTEKGLRQLARQGLQGTPEAHGTGATKKSKLVMVKVGKAKAVKTKAAKKSTRRSAKRAVGRKGK
jgi:HEAT repeat protein